MTARISSALNDIAYQTRDGVKADVGEIAQA